MRIAGASLPHFSPKIRTVGDGQDHYQPSNIIGDQEM